MIAVQVRMDSVVPFTFCRVCYPVLETKHLSCFVGGMRGILIRWCTTEKKTVDWGFVFLRISIQLDTWAYNCARKECFEICIDMK